MAAIPEKYQPDTRLVDDPQKLRELYCRDGLSIREIADEHASVSYARVHEALDEYGIEREEVASKDSEVCHASGSGPTGPVSASERGFDPPDDSGINWGRCLD